MEADAPPIVGYRPLRADDRDRLIAFHETLSREAVFRRFHALIPHLSVAMAEALTASGVGGRYAVGAVVGDGGGERIVGVARAERGATGEEIAVVVTDRWQGHGIARRLLAEVCDAMRRDGWLQAYVDVQTDNEAMLRLTPPAARICTRPPQDGLLRIHLDLRRWDAYLRGAHTQLWMAQRSGYEWWTTVGGTPQ